MANLASAIYQLASASDALTKRVHQLEQEGAQRAADDQLQAGAAQRAAEEAQRDINRQQAEAAAEAEQLRARVREVEERAEQRVAQALTRTQEAAAAAEAKWQQLEGQAAQQLLEAEARLERMRAGEQARLDAQLAAVQAGTAAAQRAHHTQLRRAHDLALQRMRAAAEAKLEADMGARTVEGIAADLRALVPDAQCLVCSEEVKICDGVSCPSEEAHFMCSECFSACVSSQSSHLSVHAAHCRGRIRCPFAAVDGHAVAFDDQVVAQHVDADLFGAYQDARGRLQEHDINVRLEADYNERLERELEHAMQLSAHLQAVRRARHHVLSDILTIKCPACQAGWVHDGGCMALTCQCNRFICSYCARLFETSLACHDHVRVCGYGPHRNDYYGSAADEESAHRRLRSERMQAYVATLEAAVRKDVLEACARELQDLGLDATAFMG